ncbi:MAG: type II/IV secretion system protein [Ignavibacteriae bacterium]|nr:MAG: type II/IV secretion system protein [Ignavibacteriota bacterium]
MAVTPQQPVQPHQTPQPQQRIALEQLDIKSLSKDKIRDLFRQGKLPTADQIVEEILMRAVQEGANDIHVEPIEGEMQIRFGHEGTLRRVVSLPSDMNDSVISVLKSRATMNQFEKKKPQEGRYSAMYGAESLDFRVNVIPVLSGERCLVRLLRKTASISRIEDLGFGRENLKRFRTLLRFPRGLLLVTGPSGSGKTTTVYAAVNYVASPEKCVITVEDPVEYRLPYASQVHLPPDKSFNFIDALRAILRQNPNIIMVGEIRDAETGIVAGEAALTGNLVLSTMLADDAIGAIHRLLNLGVPAYWLASTVVGIVYQLLIRKICPNCKEEYQLSPEELQMVGAPMESSDLKLFRGRGCPNCMGTGYKGRVAISEIVTISPALRDMIFQKESILAMREEASNCGFQAIRQDAVRKALSGITTLNEITRVLG